MCQFVLNVTWLLGFCLRMLEYVSIRPKHCMVFRFLFESVRICVELYHMLRLCIGYCLLVK